MTVKYKHSIWIYIYYNDYIKMYFDYIKIINDNNIDLTYYDLLKIVNNKEKNIINMFINSFYINIDNN